MRSKDLIEIFARIFGSIAKAFKRVLRFIDSELKKKSAQNDVAIEQSKIQQQELQQKIHQNQVNQYFMYDYWSFRSGVKNCLQSDPSRYGVVSPKRVEDVSAPESEQISATLLSNGLYENIVFRFEVKREPVSVNLHTITTGTAEYVPEKEVQRQLQHELPKYIGDYRYSSLSVIDAGDRRLIIIVQNVYRQQHW